MRRDGRTSRCAKFCIDEGRSETYSEVVCPRAHARSARLKEQQPAAAASRCRSSRRVFVVMKS